MPCLLALEFEILKMSNNMAMKGSDSATEWALKKRD